MGGTVRLGVLGWIDGLSPPWAAYCYYISGMGEAPARPNLRQIILTKQDRMGGAAAIPKYY